MNQFGLFGKNPKGIRSRVVSAIAQEVFNAKQLVVLCRSIRATQRPGFDLAGIGGHCEISDEGVGGLPGTVRDDG